MTGGIGGEFLQILQNIDWNSLDAKSATLLRAALKSALVKSDEWFAELARDFGSAPSVTPAKLPVGRPPVEALHPREPTPSASVMADPPKRKRGRPPKKKVDIKVTRPAATPLAVGGADAETQAGPQPAKLFENSYVSKEGPRPGAALPADHPRRGLNRESSVTPEVDMSDFHTVEEAMRSGKGLKDVFQ